MRRLIARLDNVGDVVLAGPAVRAAAHRADHVVFLAGPSGAEAARLLPGVDSVLEFDAPWVPYEPRAYDAAAVRSIIERIRSEQIDQALILTSFHQSPLPLAMVLREAGVPWIVATSTEYPGALLDVRVPYVETLHEVEQSLFACQQAGFDLPPDDDGALRLDVWPSDDGPRRPFVVVHPGASVQARALPIDPIRELVGDLTAAGRDVVITGSADEAHLARTVAEPGTHVRHACGSMSLREFAELIGRAAVVICGNTAPAHIAAAMGTPVVEAFAPVVPAHRWHPWMVPHVLLGHLDIGCAGCRHRSCPIEGQPCLVPFNAVTVARAMDSLSTSVSRRQASHGRHRAPPRLAPLRT